MNEPKKSLWGRWVLIAIVVGCAMWAWAAHRTDARPWGMALGQDLRGGTTLRFSLDLEAARRVNKIPVEQSDASVVADTLKVIETRVNRFGLAELNLAQIGDDKFEISIPAEVDADSIKKVVQALGELEFRIEVLPAYDAFRGDRGERRERDQVWTGATGPAVEGETAETFEPNAAGFEKFKGREIERWKQARERGEAYVPLDARYRVVPREASGRTASTDFAVVEEPSAAEQRMSGQILTNIRAGADSHGNPRGGVHFDVKGEYQNVFHAWTGANVGLPMAILLNGEFHSAPIINSPLKDSVIVSLGGGSFMASPEQDQRLADEQKQLVAVLQSGALKVQPVVESENTVGATLAGQAVQRGLWSTLIAFALVLAFMLIYYLVAGAFADLALVLNLVLLIGAMAFLEATLTLPGIAGIVLTLGMAVDANILVFERIREEQARGRPVARAVAEGFDRAFTTIVDSNVTTLFTAAFLYAYGTGAIKGFAVTLALGLLASMFTAVFVTRTFFETWLASGRVSKVRMLGQARPPTIGWMRLRKVFIPVSVALMVLSFVAFVASKDETVYDIDFTGGMKVQARFSAPTTVDQVKDALDEGAKDVRIPKPDALPGSGETAVVRAGPYARAEAVSVGVGDLQVEVRHPLAVSGDVTGGLSDRAQLDAFRAYLEETLRDRLMPPWVKERPTAYVKKGDDDPKKDFDGRLRFQIAVEDPQGALTTDVVRNTLTRMPYWSYEAGASRRIKLPSDRVTRTIEVVETTPAAAAGTKRSARSFELWWKSDLAAASTPAETNPETLLADVREYMAGPSFDDALVAAGVPSDGARLVLLADPFPVNDLIGPGVAKRMRDDALVALLLSFVAIIVYVAFRFRSYAMGFAAVLCLVHDVTIALGAVVLADHLGFVDAKINMGLVAAFLTIVGYSVNDTVVTFDRLRELRGKSPKITSGMIDDAVNQTLARTIRTTLTVFLTLVVLFAVNLGQRSLLEGISYTLLAGTAVGVYSTIGIAAPLLLFLPWFWVKIRAYRPRLFVATWPARKPWGLVLAAAAVALTIAVWLTTGEFWLGVFWGLFLLPILATVGVLFAWAIAFGIFGFIAGLALVVPWSFQEDPERALEQVKRDLPGGALPAAGAAAKA